MARKAERLTEMVTEFRIVGLAHRIPKIMWQSNSHIKRLDSRDNSFRFFTTSPQITENQ